MVWGWGSRGYCSAGRALWAGHVRGLICGGGFSLFIEVIRMHSSVNLT